MDIIDNIPTPEELADILNNTPMRGTPGLKSSYDCRQSILAASFYLQSETMFSEDPDFKKEIYFSNRWDYLEIERANESMITISNNSGYDLYTFGVRALEEKVPFSFGIMVRPEDKWKSGFRSTAFYNAAGEVTRTIKSKAICIPTLFNYQDQRLFAAISLQEWVRQEIQDIQKQASPRKD